MTGRGMGTESQRHDGILDRDAVRSARLQGAALGFCPVRIGWVRLESDDAISMDPPLSWHVGRADAGHRTPLPPAFRDRSGFTFRPWSVEDLPAYRAALLDGDLWHFMPEEAPAALDEADALALIDLLTASSHHMVCAIVQEGAPIGQVRLEFLTDGTRAELGYWLMASARGRGLGRRAIAAFLDETLPQFPHLSALVARVHPGNHASARVLRGCGFEPADRAVTGLAPRGRDGGDWPVFIRPLA